MCYCYNNKTVNSEGYLYSDHESETWHYICENSDPSSGDLQNDFIRRADTY